MKVLTSSEKVRYFALLFFVVMAIGGLKTHDFSWTAQVVDLTTEEINGVIKILLEALVTALGYLVARRLRFSFKTN
jgi:hypothetical protein